MNSKITYVKSHNTKAIIDYGSEGLNSNRLIKDYVKPVFRKSSAHNKLRNITDVVT